MNTEIDKWLNLRDQADRMIKETLKDKQEPQKSSMTAKALALYARSDITVKTLQMNQHGPSKSEY